MASTNEDGSPYTGAPISPPAPPPRARAEISADLDAVLLDLGRQTYVQKITEHQIAALTQRAYDLNQEAAKASEKSE